MVDFKKVQDTLLSYIHRGIDSFALLRYVYWKRGFGYFRLPILVCVLVSLVIYFGVYKSAFESKNEKNAIIETLSSQKNYSQEYFLHRDAITQRRQALPNKQEIDKWLTNYLLGIAKPLDIIFEAVTTQSQIDTPDFIIVSVFLSTKIPFDKAAKLVASIESSEKLLFVEELTIEKDTEDLENIDLKLKVSTIFEK
jgi:hypothetical protein